MKTKFCGRKSRTMPFNARYDVQSSDKCREARCATHCMCAKSAIHKRYLLLIGTNNIVRYDVTSFSPFGFNHILLFYIIYNYIMVCWTNRRFRWSDKIVVDAFVIRALSRIMSFTLDNAFFI